MTSSLLKVSIMTQMNINFRFLLFYIFLRNVIAFNKELAILARGEGSSFPMNLTSIKKPMKDRVEIKQEIFISQME